MHYFINVCACCLKSDCSLSEYSIKNEKDCDSPIKHIQQIQTIYPDLQLNNTLPLQLCNNCLQLMYEATQIKQYLEQQERNVQSQNRLLTENTCSGCLNTSTIYFDQEFYMNASKVCRKQCIDMIREALPQYKVDSCKSYKYCQCCSKSIKSLYLLKSLVTRNNTMYEKYCLTMFSNKHFQNCKFSQLSISLQKTTSTQDNSIDFKIEKDACNDKFLTYPQQNSLFYEGPFIKDEICIKDEYSFEYTKENYYFQDPSSSENTLITNHEISTVLGHDQMTSDVKLYNNYTTKSCIAKSNWKDYENIETKETYACDYCLKSFTQKSALKAHKTTERPYNCNYCVKSFTQKGHLIKHKRTHSHEKPYKCKYCTKSFTASSYLKAHEKTHTGDKPYKCIYCTKSFPQKFQLILHKRTHTGEKPFKCKFCAKSVTASSNLKRHEKIHTGEKPYKCNYCTLSFTRNGYLKDHERSHSGKKPYKCNYCAKTFRDGSNLKRHEIIHTGRKPFRCNYCTKSFAISTDLKRHERAHTGEKPFKCNYCTKSFAISSDLKRHERAHTGEKPYKCNYCTKSFTENKSLKRHERNHTGGKPYKCNYCAKCFARNDCLKLHERIHTGEKPYKCKYCTKSFANSSNLIVHERIHSGMTP